MASTTYPALKIAKGKLTGLQARDIIKTLDADVLSCSDLATMSAVAADWFTPVEYEKLFGKKPVFDALPEEPAGTGAVAIIQFNEAKKTAKDVAAASHAIKLRFFA